MRNDDSRQQRSDGKGTPTLEAIASVIDKAQELAAAGHHAAVVEFLGGRERTELGDSPTLALLYGIAQARLGRHDQALPWLHPPPPPRAPPRVGARGAPHPAL